MDSEKRPSYISFLLVVFFIIGLILFQLQLFHYGFIFILFLLLTISFLHEQERIFVWTSIAFLVGDFLFLYGDRLLDELMLPREIVILLNRSLLIIPILFITYITLKFKQPLLNSWKKPNWQEKIHFPFIWTGFHSVSIKWFLVIAISINLAAFLPALINSHFQFTLSSVVYILSFSIINSCLEEILWRGLLLTRVSSIMGDKWAVIMTGIAFGLSHLSLGYSVITCLGFALGGMFYAGVTIKSGSLLPSIIWHAILNVFMILGGVIPIL